MMHTVGKGKRRESKKKEPGGPGSFFLDLRRFYETSSPSRLSSLMLLVTPSTPKTSEAAA